MTEKSITHFHAVYDNAPARKTQKEAMKDARKIRREGRNGEHWHPTLLRPTLPQ